MVTGLPFNSDGDVSNCTGRQNQAVFFFKMSGSRRANQKGGRVLDDYTSLKLTACLYHGWLEDDPFRLGRPIFRGELAGGFREGRALNV